MTVEKLPDLDLPAMGQVIDAGRPVLSYGWAARGAHRAAAHSHPRAHLIAPVSGAYWVVTEEGTWLVPEGLAIWLPPGVRHEVYSHASVSARILFVDPAWAGGLPQRGGTVRISALMEALLARIIEEGNAYGPDSPAARLAMVMLDELSRMEFSRLPLPVSKEPRLARVMAEVIASPLGETGLDELARGAGASARTLARLFQAETGMSFTQWRTNLRLAEAIRRLAEGSTITEVAFDLGYSSASAFTYMFRRNLGVPPRRYRDGEPGS